MNSGLWISPSAAQIHRNSLNSKSMVRRDPPNLSLRMTKASCRIFREGALQSVGLPFPVETHKWSNLRTHSFCGIQKPALIRSFLFQFETICRLPEHSSKGSHVGGPKETVQATSDSTLLLAFYKAQEFFETLKFLNWKILIYFKDHPIEVLIASHFD